MTSQPSSVTSENEIIDAIAEVGFLLEGGSALVAVKAPDLRYMFANRELEQLFNASPGALVGTRVTDWLHTDEANAMMDRDRSVMRSGKPERCFEEFVIGDRQVTCATVRFPYRDSAGKTIGMGFVAIDILDEDHNKIPDIVRALKDAQDTISELQKTVEQMRLQATTDALTGVWNRGQSEEMARHEMARLHRYGHPLSMILVDIDHFKRVNDTWGHPAGDRVLKGFCDLTRTCLRSTDLLGRWGGEEFMILLPNTGLARAQLVAERTRLVLEEYVFPEIGRVTASFGVVSCTPTDSLPSWFARADAALYRAKQSGRNQVETDVESLALEQQVEKVTPGFVGLIWRKAYECGHPVIDRQHRLLFDISNQLLAAVLGGQPKEDVTALINALLAEVVRHFEDEETILHQAGFAGADEHADIHRQLVKKASRLAESYAQGELELGDLFTFLAHDVVARHMLAEDRQFFPYVAGLT